MSSALSSSSDLTMRDRSSDCPFAARGASLTGALGVFVFGAFAVFATAFALDVFAGFAAFAALAFFGAVFVPAVLRVRIQLLRSTQRCARNRTFSKNPPVTALLPTAK
jgi:hypothetical protein